MLERVKITNFRRFRELEVSPATRINVITGSNNAGKTSLLEAIFLLSSGGNLSGVNIGRYVQGLTKDTRSPAVVQRVLWKPMFSALDTGASIEIAADDAAVGAISVKIYFGDPDEGQRKEGASGKQYLVCTFWRGNEEVGKSSHLPDGTDVRFTPGSMARDTEIPFSANILPPYLDMDTTSSEPARLLGVLRQRKQGDLVVGALQAIEPRLQSIEENSSSGSPMIWGDIGLSELVPLSVMGGGMVRIVRLALAMAAVEGGVLLVDEIENGIHHSALADVWRVIDDMSKKLGTQVFATTHSYECLQAAASAIEGDDLSIHRLETDEDASRCVTLGRSQIDSVVEYRMEVR